MEEGELRVRMPPHHRQHSRPGPCPHPHPHRRCRLAKGLFVAVVYFFCALLQMDMECYTNKEWKGVRERGECGREGDLEGNKVEKVREKEAKQ